MLLIVARDELRSFHLPDLRSGPLYRIVGENLSLAWLGGQSGEGGVLMWVANHRKHHAYSDKQGDPPDPDPVSET